MNINEIAKLAGVSRATVSRYLNQGYVSEEKKEQIRRVIDETGYKPSAQAQTLRTKKTNLIGVILPKINSDSISRMVAGISSVLSKSGYQLLLANTENKEAEELKYLEIFAESHVDGIILIGTIFTREHKKALKDLQVPVVILGQSLPGYSCVYYDDFHAAYELTGHMLKKGKNFGYIGVTEKDQSAGAMRKSGFKAALHEAGIIVPEERMMTAGFNMESGYNCADQLLKQNADIDSIFCATDSIAVGAMRCIQDAGKCVPEDIQIVGVGDSNLAHVVQPRLTTIHYFYKTSGMEAAKMLINILNDEDKISREIKMGYKLVVADSTRKSGECE